MKRKIRKNKGAKIFLLAAIATIAAGCHLLKPAATVKAPPDELFYVLKYDPQNSTFTHGYMDRTGKIAVGPWRSIEWNGRKYGEEKGTDVRFFPFFEGMAGVCLYDEAPPDADKAHCGFIDKTGKLAVEPKYNLIGYFSEGLAAVSTDSLKSMGRTGYIDKTGKLVIEPKYASFAAFHDGLAPFVEPVVEGGKQSLKTGYMDKTGKVAIDRKWDMMGNFEGGYAVVINSGAPPTIIDKSGEVVKTVDTESAGNTDYFYKKDYESDPFKGYTVEDNTLTSFNEGLAMSFDRSKLKPVGYVNAKGELEIKLDPAIVGEIRPFSEGFAPVGWRIMIYDRELPGEKYDWTFIDRAGEVKVKLDDTFMDARSFSEGMAAVKTRKSDGRWTFVDAQFRETMPACFEAVNDFRGGLALVRVVEYAQDKMGCERYYSGVAADKREFYVDKAGNVVSPQW